MRAALRRQQRQQKALRAVSYSGVAREQALSQSRCDAAALEQDLADHKTVRTRLLTELNDAKVVVEAQGSAAQSGVQAVAEAFGLQTRLLSRQEDWAKEESRLRGLLGLTESDFG